MCLKSEWTIWKGWDRAFDQVHLRLEKGGNRLLERVLALSLIIVEKFPVWMVCSTSGGRIWGKPLKVSNLFKSNSKLTELRAIIFYFFSIWLWLHPMACILRTTCGYMIEKNITISKSQNVLMISVIFSWCMPHSNYMKLWAVDIETPCMELKSTISEFFIKFTCFLKYYYTLLMVFIGLKIC